MKKAIIVSTIDNFANGVKPQELKRYLEKNGFDVDVLPGAHRTSKNDICDNMRLSKNKVRYLFVLVGLMVIKKIRNETIQLWVKSSINIMQFKEYGQITHARLKVLSPDLIICESNIDIGFVALDRIAKVQILDLPCPSAEELFFGNMITRRAYEKFKGTEVESYKNADALSFHWHTYSDYVRKTKYDGNNIIDMGYGSYEKDNTASFSSDARVIFLGYLKGYWVNLDLLEKLCKAYPNIDVYGGPEPSKDLKINYKGYAPTLEVMADYQFGLTTITNDDLRKNSFSSKHLEYISYGLPVFTPSWRKDFKLDDSSIYYSDAEDFGVQLEKYSKAGEWQSKHNSALSTAKAMSWENAFVDLGITLSKYGLLKKGEV